MYLISYVLVQSWFTSNKRCFHSCLRCAWERNSTYHIPFLFIFFLFFKYLFIFFMGAGGGTFGQTNPPERGSLFVISTGTVVAILLVLLVSPIHFTLSDYELGELSFHHKIALRWPTFTTTRLITAVIVYHLSDE